MLVSIPVPTEAAVKKYQFDVVMSNVSRLCHAKPIVTVNGRFPGPTIYAREGDRTHRQRQQPRAVQHDHPLVYSLISRTPCLLKLHTVFDEMPHEWRHGVKQLRNGWADGPAYITQCPIQSGGSYTYDFNATGPPGSEELYGGTLTSCGCAPPCTAPLLSCRRKEFPIHFRSLIKKLN
ncbi:hypothetical protein Cni_G19734 [Canna indica]|uniref:Plastocyanin-like domain-containing protein n=1 Tax=Canna indica TaxID=4628 RepID=A0AAQ3KQ11_9LILI|nr:hypothetical protein Cni_G19734 [Canna indica]